MTSTASIPAPPIEGGILGTTDVATELGEIRTNWATKRSSTAAGSMLLADFGLFDILHI